MGAQFGAFEPEVQPIENVAAQENFAACDIARHIDARKHQFSKSQIDLIQTNRLSLGPLRSQYCAFQIGRIELTQERQWNDGQVTPLSTIAV